MASASRTRPEQRGPAATFWFRRRAAVPTALGRISICFAWKTDPCHSRHGHAQSCRTVRDHDFPAVGSLM